MTCDGKDGKKCSSGKEATWEHPVYMHGQLLGVIHTCDEHKHCGECEPIKAQGDEQN